ncbi:hypothetical protein HDA40_006110 [Hamadaea flava]|uniref:Uncharacterized protein n=1 Tax=Hamadaea flava TaxID=1742688 RepID=A0ABV8LVW3_9ACTN|nr:hypothetical protein [Hamadaea flava]MCP2327603.1 hypothetical protein [Hamadaea flava]
MTSDETLREYVKRMVDQAPPLSPERRELLRALLRPAVEKADAGFRQRS